MISEDLAQAYLQTDSLTESPPILGSMAGLAKKCENLCWKMFVSMVSLFLLYPRLPFTYILSKLESDQGHPQLSMS